MKNYVKQGNSKLGPKVLVWTMSRKSCINKTDWCRKNCYGIKAEKQYGQHVLTPRQERYELSKQSDFSDIIIAELKRKKSKDYFRIHEVGDFYSNEYIDHWIKIVKEFPKTKFIAFTKSYSLKPKILELNEEPNITLYESLDESRQTQQIPEIFYSDVYKGVRTETPTELICPVGITIKHPACEKCGYLCWNAPNNVVFKQH